MGSQSVSVSFVIAMLSLLSAGAWRDIATRTIPDGVGLLLFAIGGIARLLQGPALLFSSVSTALLLFLVLIVVHSRGLIGGGDVKLMTALAVGLSPFDCYRFVVATVLAGGILGVAHLLLARSIGTKRMSRRTSLLARIIRVETWRIRRHGPLPYGVAIAAGGAFVLLHPGSF